MSSTPRVESSVPARIEDPTWVVKTITLIVSVVVVDYLTSVFVVIIVIVVIVRIVVVRVLRRI